MNFNDSNLLSLKLSAVKFLDAKRRYLLFWSRRVTYNFRSSLRETTILEIRWETQILEVRWETDKENGKNM